MSALIDARQEAAAAITTPALPGFRFVGDFLLPKLIIYLAPLATAAIVSSQVYGAVELAYGVSATLGAALVGAPLHGLSHRYLTGRDQDYRDQVAVIALVIAAVSLVALALAAGFGAPPGMLIFAAMLGVVGLQIELSLVVRMLELQRFVGWAQGLALISVCGASGVAWSLGVDPLGPLLFALGGILAVGGTTGALFLMRRRKRHLGVRLWLSIRAGGAMAAFSVLNSWAGVSGRVLVGFLSFSELPSYAAAFRVAGLGVGLYQIGTTIYWARLYRQRTREADRLVAILLASTVLFALVVSLAGPTVLGALDFLALQGSAQERAAALVPVVTLQAFFWAANSLLQPRVNRAGVARKLVRLLTVIAVVGAGVIAVAAAAGASLTTLCWLLVGYSASFFAASLYVLMKRGLPHRRTAVVGVAGGLLLAAVALVQLAR